MSRRSPFDNGVRKISKILISGVDTSSPIWYNRKKQMSINPIYDKANDIIQQYGLSSKSKTHNKIAQIAQILQDNSTLPENTNMYDQSLWN